MDIDNGGAPAPADTPSVAIENIPTPPAPIDTAGPERQEAAVEPEKPSSSVSEAIKKAEAKLEAKEQKTEQKVDPKEAKVEAKPEAKVEPKEPQPRENGKFAAKEQASAEAKPVAKPSHTAEDAPARFTETAKAKWASADPEIRGEVRRMEKELTDGYQKHKQAAERDGELADFHEMATKHGTTVKDALTKYTNMENLLRQDVVKGLSAICENAGVSLKDVAAHVLNQSPDQQASQSDATIRELKQQIQSLTEQVGGVTKTFQEQREQSTVQEINKFASEPEHARFEELAEDIAFFMKTGRASGLSEAYELAERLNPAQRQAPQTAPVNPDPEINTEAQTLRGQKSIAPGSPPTSSSLASRKPSSSIRGALEAAMARAS